MPASSLERPWVGAGAFALGGLVGAAAFAVPGSPLYQAELIWKAYQALAVPFFALWAWDRLVRRPPPFVLALDAAVVLAAGARAFALIPFVSGHALFLAYALATTREGVQAALTLGLLVTVIFKLVGFHDVLTLAVGMTIGAVLGGWGRRLRGALKGRLPGTSSPR